jgi:hypothetical protein
VAAPFAIRAIAGRIKIAFMRNDEALFHRGVMLLIALLVRGKFGDDDAGGTGALAQTGCPALSGYCRIG